MDLFPAASLVRDMQTELDAMIQQGVFQLTRLLKNSETGVSSGTLAAIDEDEFAINRQKQSYLRGIVSLLKCVCCSSTVVTSCI
jgi:ATP-dependent RNA helicase SUPV3L1/SUV3